MAVLSYLDFFPTGVQRVAVTTASNVSQLSVTNQLVFDVFRYAAKSQRNVLILLLIQCHCLPTFYNIPTKK